MNEKVNINQINHLAEEEVKLNVVAKVRLGRKGGKGVPEGKFDYFFLRDPDGPNEYHLKLIERYGKTPKDLPIKFVSTDLEKIMPTSYMWYRGRGKGNSAGELYCQGNGPHKDGTPGKAVVWGERDQATRIAPTRECKGKDCKDYKSADGKPQCKPKMRLIFMTEGVAGGCLSVVTESMNTMRQFRRVLTWALGVPVLKDNWTKIPWVIYRNKKETTYWDSASKKTKKGLAYPMFLRLDEEKFRELEDGGFLTGEDAKGNVKVEIKGLDEVCREDAEDAMESDTVAFEQKEDKAFEILCDPEVQNAFKTLEDALGKPYSEKNKLISIRQRGCNKEALCRDMAAKAEELKRSAYDQEQKPSLAQG